MKNTWMFPAIQAIHVIAMAMFVGTIALGDFIRLGLARQDLNASHVARWTWSGFGVMAITGVLMFLADSARYANNPAFRWKLVLLMVALVLHLTFHRGSGSKAGAALSLVLWSAVVLAARAIADFDI